MPRWTGMNNKITADEADEAAPRIGEQIIVKTYTGSQAEATKSFQADAVRMANQGYFPVFQSWAPGQWRSGAFIAALLLCFLIVGIPALIYMKVDLAITGRPIPQLPVRRRFRWNEWTRPPPPRKAETNRATGNERCAVARS